MKNLLMSPGRLNKVFLCTVVLLIVFGMIYSEEMRPLTGKELLEKITSDKKEDSDYALGYITGVYCAYLGTSVPDDRTLKKVVKTVKRYLKKNPEKLNRPAVELLKEILVKA